MTKPVSEIQRCPLCDEPLVKPQAPCGHCGWISPGSDYQPPLQFNISGLLALTGFVATLAAAFRWAPGLAILLLIVSVPPLLRAITMITRREAAEGRRMDLVRRGRIFIGSLGFVVAMAIAGGAAFLASCFSGGWVMFWIFENHDVILWAFVLGIVIQAIVTNRIATWSQRTQNTDGNYLGDIGFLQSWVGFAMFTGLLITKLLQNSPIRYIGDQVLFGSVSVIPGLICSFRAFRRPRRFTASCGIGCGLVAVGQFFLFLWGRRWLNNENTSSLAITSFLLLSFVGAIVLTGLFYKIGGDSKSR